MAKKTDTQAKDIDAERKAASQPVNDKMVEDQQTGGTNDAVTETTVQVEPVQPAGIVEANPPVVGEAQHGNQPVDYAPKAELEVPKPVDLKSLPPFDAFVRKHEDAAAAIGLVVTGLTHPHAPDTNGIYKGRDAGIRVAKGSPSAQYSDGSKH
ncbi:hypothetical protein CAL26_05140 [Bordetella genomosp. 9]|uniref:Uncharacterized protein n=1 Tax=Bordetella genomosp. 9 TaxID=1416803 RepID=A0A261RNR4_9BORD|nr:hypothetical protein [Bordetella genomosp. 9]OZI26708.1 hypothetical protein CAL26_05140 [Bordetella genomosp. 9]